MSLDPKIIVDRIELSEQKKRVICDGTATIAFLDVNESDGEINNNNCFRISKKASTKHTKC